MKPQTPAPTPVPEDTIPLIASLIDESEEVPVADIIPGVPGYISESSNPSALNTIPAGADGVINLLDVLVGGYTCSYRIYDGGTWTGGYIYIWQPEMTLRGELAGSTDSIDGKAVTKSSSVHYLIDSPKVGPSGIGAKANIIVTTPVGGQTTMIGYVTFYFGSSTGITVMASAESVVRSNPFTVTVSGLPNTQYFITLDSGKSPVPQLIPGQPGVVRGSENPKVNIGWSEKTCPSAGRCIE